MKRLSDTVGFSKETDSPIHRMVIELRARVQKYGKARLARELTGKIDKDTVYRLLRGYDMKMSSIILIAAQMEGHK